MGTKHIERTNRAMLETMMTAEDALAWAKDYQEERGRWPSRRFRLEGSRGGNSRLVSRKVGEQLRCSMGARWWN